MLYDEFGEKLLTGRHPCLKEYLAYRIKTALQIENELRLSEKDRARERLREISEGNVHAAGGNEIFCIMRKQA